MKCLLALQEAGAADSSSEEQEQETSMQRAKEEENAMVQLPVESRVILFEDSESKVWYLLRPFDNMMVKLKIHDPVALVIQQNDQSLVVIDSDSRDPDTKSAYAHQLLASRKAMAATDEALEVCKECLRINYIYRDLAF